LLAAVEHRLPKPLRYVRVLARFTFIRNPGNDVYTTTIAFCSSQSLLWRMRTWCWREENV